MIRETIAPCLFCGPQESLTNLSKEFTPEELQEIRAARRREGRRTFRLSDIVSYVDAPQGAPEVYVCDYHIDQAREIVHDLGERDPQKMLDLYNRWLETERAKAAQEVAQEEAWKAEAARFGMIAIPRNPDWAAPVLRKELGEQAARRLGELLLGD